MTWMSCGKLVIFFSYSYFCLNQLACRYHRTKPMRKSSFHPEYRYIFCLPSRRSGQIIVRALEIVYSFWLLCFNLVFIGVLFRFFLFFLLTALAFVFFFFWVRTTTFFWIYWHVSHSPVSSSTNPLSHEHAEQEHTPYISECSCKEQWQSQLQFLHLTSVIKTFKEPLHKFFPPFFNHLWSPQYRRRIYHYLLFSIYDYLQHSIH